MVDECSMVLTTAGIGIGIIHTSNRSPNCPSMLALEKKLLLSATEYAQKPPYW